MAYDTLCCRNIGLEVSVTGSKIGIDHWVAFRVRVGVMIRVYNDEEALRANARVLITII